MTIRSHALAVMLLAIGLPAAAVEPMEVVASQDLTVRRNNRDQEPTVEKSLHPKSVQENEKNRLDRIAMIRFDSESFGKDVRGAGLLLQAKDGNLHADRFRFNVYGVRDGDKEDETFTEKDYKPAAKGSIFDDSSNMIDRRQVTLLGSFTSEPGKEVKFSNATLLAFIRADTNGTATIVITRETESGENSVFEDRTGAKPPRLLILGPQKSEQPGQEKDKPAEQAPADTDKPE